MDDKVSSSSANSSKYKPKNIPQAKLKAFQIGAMNSAKRVLSKKEEEEKKRKEDLERTAEVFKEFVETFKGDQNKLSKTWVKGDTVKDGIKVENSGKRELYNPSSKSSKLAELAATFPSSKKDDRKKEDKFQIGPKRHEQKRKTNLETFKEELKTIQTERERRHKMKDQCIQPSRRSRFEHSPDSLPVTDPLGVSLSSEDVIKTGSYPTVQDDETSTNIYLGNINPQTKENELAEIYGRFGPLASVKIMWPRDEEQRAKNRNCGFVAYMNRKDAERAMNCMQGKEIASYEQKLGWGKAVPIPPHPVYIPPALAELTMPPPQSGLAFNAQPKSNEKRINITGGDDEILKNCVVKVVVPTDRHLVQVIHRVIEFVVREGPMFEALIMNREMNNPVYRFLFENQSPGHIYYRWKLFSILQGDTPYSWRTEEFCMFESGSIWKPPPVNPWTRGMPSELVEKNVVMAEEAKKGNLSKRDVEELEDILHRISPERVSIGEAMVWCIDRADSAQQICDFIADSLSNPDTVPAKKLARLYLINDILHNCTTKANASFFRKYMEPHLSKVVDNLRKTHQTIESRLKAEQYKTRVINCLKAWEDWTVYPQDSIIHLQNIFLGLVVTEEITKKSSVEIDGAPLEDEIDGKPIGLVKYDSDDCIDGSPMDDESIANKYNERKTQERLEESFKGFQKSKWEEVDENDLKAQAVTTSKWELFDDEDGTKAEEGELDEDLDGVPMEDDYSRSITNNSRGNEVSEEKRQRLREIEVKVMKYADELESGRRQTKPGMSITDQVEQYRQKLLDKEKKYEQPLSSSLAAIKSYSPAQDSESPRSRNRSRSRSPRRRRKSRSRSPRRRKSRTRSPNDRYDRDRSRYSSTTSGSKHKHKKTRY